MVDNDFRFKIAWASMPLPEEELKKIEYGHTKRPYLLCMDKKDYYYAFPCTSNVLNNKIRYENEKAIVWSSINTKPTLVKLSELTILPKDCLLSEEAVVNKDYNNEIIKKINASSEYNEFPSDFKEFFKNMDYYYDINDVVSVGDDLYIIVDNKDNETFVSFRVYPYIVNNTVPLSTDGLNYYVDVFNTVYLKKDSINKYVTRIDDMYYDVYYDEALIKYLLSANVVKDDTDYSKFHNLEPGMIIKFEYNGNILKMIVLEKDVSYTTVLIGSEDEMYSNFEKTDLPNGIGLEYKIVGFLTEDRLEKLLDKDVLSRKLIDMQ